MSSNYEEARASLMTVNYRFAAIDFELANNSRDSICQMGVALVSQDNLITRTSLFVDPQDEFGPYQMKLHGIRPEDVAGAPLFPEALEILNGIVANTPLLQHGPEDHEFLKAACKKYALPIPEFTWHNSHKIAKHAWPELPKHGLKPLADTLGISFKHHNGEEDAAAAAEIVLKAEQHVGLPFNEIVGFRSRKKKRSPSRGASPAP